MVAFPNQKIDLFTLLKNEEYNQLSKIATRYDGFGNKTYDKLTYPKSQVGEIALIRSYSYNDTQELVGISAELSIWDQDDEDLARPPIQDIVLSSNEIDHLSPEGTLIATITTIGGISPKTYELLDDAGGKIRIDNNDELTMNAIADLADTPYNITVKVTDATGSTFNKNFSIDVVGFSNTKSLKFDGINESVNFGDVFQFDRANAWSLSVWLKPDNASNRYTIYAKATNDANVHGWSFYLNTGNTTFIQVRTNATLRQYTGTLSYNLTQWNHFVFAYDGSSNMSGISIYINGIEDVTPASESLGGTLLFGQDAIFGSRNTAFPFVGNLDEATIWNKKLSASDVTELYNGGDPNNPSQHSAAANLTNWYRMGDVDIFPTISDQIGTADGTMINMESGDIRNDVP